MDLVRAWRDLDPRDRPRFELLIGRAERLVVLLGAFDPPTLAHVAVLAAAASSLDRPAAFCMTKVLLDRPDDVLLEPERRLGLLAALGEEHGFCLAVCNRGTYLEVDEAARAGGIDAVFVIGSDKLAQIHDPSFYADGSAGAERTFEQVGFVVAERDRIVAPDGMRVLDLADRSAAGVSASEVRRRVRAGASVDDLVPALVARALHGYTERTERG